jgi:hypothetical protein
LPGGKGPASSTGGESFVSGNLGLIALFALVILVFGGIVAANQAGLFNEETGAAGEVQSCEQTFVGSTVHEHASLEVYLDSDQPYDFSAGRYQMADRGVHFENGAQDANGARIHVHEARPTLGCLFETLSWTVDQEDGEPVRIETDQGEVYTADEGDLEILLNGEPADRGWNTPIQQQDRFTIRYTEDAGGANGTGTNSSG